MVDREKVIKGLECCLPPHDQDCDLCPYDSIDLRCRSKLHEDVMALLKTQESTSTPEAEWLLYKGRHGATCSFCKHTYHDVYDVENYDYYCRHCGAKMVRIRAVKWE